MNAQVAGLEEGDRVQVEYSVPAKISYAAEEVEGDVRINGCDDASALGGAIGNGLD